MSEESASLYWRRRNRAGEWLPWREIKDLTVNFKCDGMHRGYTQIDTLSMGSTEFCDCEIFRGDNPSQDKTPPEEMKLKPCPGCGADAMDARYIDCPPEGYYQVKCSCHWGHWAAGATREEARSAWNQMDRSTKPPTESHTMDRLAELMAEHFPLPEPLKSCPFCGGHADLKYQIGIRDQWASCADCGAEGPVAFELEKQDGAVGLWNKRAKESAE